MKFIRRLLYVLVAIVVAGITVLGVSAYTSLDGSLLHTQETAKLPLFSDHHADGLVQIRIGDDTFRARIAGFTNEPSNGKRNLILLHGFPETSIMWEPLITAAAAAGHRVVAFDQRGYSPGARPAGAANYTSETLVADTLAIADAAGFEQFHLVGHDWGAGVGWQVVLTNPDRLTTWTALSIPHIAAFGAAIANDPDQQSKSAYMGFFQMAWLPEQIFAFNDFSMMRGAMYADHAASHLDEYMAVFSEPGALTSALNWYRAAGSLGASGSLQVDTPTLFIWGNRDPAVGQSGVEAQRPYMQGPFKEVEIDTGHWLMSTATDQVVEEILEHLN